MTVDWTKLFASIGQSVVPLVKEGLAAYAEGKAQEKKLDAFNQRIVKLQNMTGSKSPSGPKLTTGILGNESVEDLGRRKWREYETVLEALPDNAAPSQVQSTLQKIQTNITKDYPCESCRENAKQNLKKFPLITTSVATKKDAQKSLCNFHNVVREMLGKEITHNCGVIFD